MIIDLNPDSWTATSAANGPDIQEVAEERLTFLRAFSLLHSENTVSFIAAHPSTSKMIYSPQIRARKLQAAGKSSTTLEMDTIDFDLHKLIVEFSTEVTENQTNTSQGMPSTLSSALAIAACNCNKYTPSKVGSSTSRKMVSRVLVITVSSDYSGQYVSLMNCFFSFEKSGILLDSLILSESVIMQSHRHFVTLSPPSPHIQIQAQPTSVLIRVPQPNRTQHPLLHSTPYHLLSLRPGLSRSYTPTPHTRLGRRHIIPPDLIASDPIPPVPAELNTAPRPRLAGLRAATAGRRNRPRRLPPTAAPPRRRRRRRPPPAHARCLPLRPPHPLRPRRPHRRRAAAPRPSRRGGSARPGPDENIKRGA